MLPYHETISCGLSRCIEALRPHHSLTHILSVSTAFRSPSGTHVSQGWPGLATANVLGGGVVG